MIEIFTQPFQFPIQLALTPKVLTHPPCCVWIQHADFPASFWWHCLGLMTRRRLRSMESRRSLPWSTSTRWPKWRKDLTLSYSHQRIPNLYSGELDTVDILVWMTEQTEGSHIEAVSDEILAMLIRRGWNLWIWMWTCGEKIIATPRQLCIEKGLSCLWYWFNLSSVMCFMQTLTLSFTGSMTTLRFSSMTAMSNKRGGRPLDCFVLTIV